MEFIYFFLIGLAGILLHITMKFRDAISKEPRSGRKFKEHFLAVWGKFDILRHMIYGIFALLLVLVIVLIRDKIVNVFPVTELTILAVGYAADSAFKNLKPESIKE